MATLDWQLRRMDGVTLVELSVRADHATRVCIESHLQPVWPPRECGVPARGWQENSFEGTVPADAPLVVGYATPAPPQEPPVEIATTGGPEESGPTPRRLVRALGDARPPRDVLPATPPPDTNTEPRAATVNRVEQDPGDSTGAAARKRQATPAAAGAETEPTAWFEAVEDRLAETERLAAATDAAEVREAVEAAGGIEEVRALQAQLDVDRQQLQDVRQRAETLADELAAADLPLATLERVV
ncbi:hypothetical protein SAMN05216226_11441 [Halovenus aranensis]|uniref:DUF8080 domain-containing protein n=1 Tax=Halovenus aranensis TaxID=890420 RepID=A0A1G8YD57_9EURY|nr:hypothetical protein [Halovenus aranensis]SDK00656.1 hypothetical protein SAMN05216226_11441 [Halovenus aranensis]